VPDRPARPAKPELVVPKQVCVGGTSQFRASTTVLACVPICRSTITACRQTTGMPQPALTAPAAAAAHPHTPVSRPGAQPQGLRPVPVRPPAAQPGPHRAECS
jgi:hypothetical protein